VEPWMTAPTEFGQSLPQIPSSLTCNLRDIFSLFKMPSLQSAILVVVVAGTVACQALENAIYAKTALKPWCLLPSTITHPTCPEQHLNQSSRRPPHRPHRKPEEEHFEPPITLSEFIFLRPYLSHSAIPENDDFPVPHPKPADIEPTTPRTMARVYADVNANMPRSYWDYDSVNISWGALENYEVVRKIGMTRYV